MWIFWELATDVGEGGGAGEEPPEAVGFAKDEMHLRAERPNGVECGDLEPYRHEYARACNACDKRLQRSFRGIAPKPDDATNE